MLKYAICEIGGKQVKIIPGQAVEFAKQADSKEIEANVLLALEDNNLKIGKPYLDKKLKLNILETIKKDKIRVAKYQAKANYRRVIGFRAKMTKVILPS